MGKVKQMCWQRLIQVGYSETDESHQPEVRSHSKPLSETQEDLNWKFDQEETPQATLLQSTVDSAVLVSSGKGDGWRKAESYNYLWVASKLQI